MPKLELLKLSQINGQITEIGHTLKQSYGKPRRFLKLTITVDIGYVDTIEEAEQRLENIQKNILGHKATLFPQ